MSAGTTVVGRVVAERQRRSSLERAVTRAFWQAVQQEPMPVMAALEAVARAVGALYRDAAAAHGPGGCCGCGWRPDPETDLMILEAMLADGIEAAPSDDLGRMTVAGSA